jgi:hypothetical protein
MSDAEIKTTTCYLLIGDANGALDVAMRAQNGKITELSIQPQSGFGEMVWRIVAQMLIDAPLEFHALKERAEQMHTAKLIPDELDLTPLVRALVNLGKE